MKSTNESSENEKYLKCSEGGSRTEPPPLLGQTPRVGTLEFDRVGINTYTCYINIILYYYCFFKSSVHTFAWGIIV